MLNLTFFGNFCKLMDKNIMYPHKATINSPYAKYMPYRYILCTSENVSIFAQRHLRTKSGLWQRESFHPPSPVFHAIFLSNNPNGFIAFALLHTRLWIEYSNAYQYYAIWMMLGLYLHTDTPIFSFIDSFSLDWPIMSSRWINLLIIIIEIIKLILPKHNIILIHREKAICQNLTEIINKNLKFGKVDWT